MPVTLPATTGGPRPHPIPNSGGLVLHAAELDALLAVPEGYADDAPIESDFHAHRLPESAWRHSARLDGIDSVIQVHRLREVLALAGFTRLEPVMPNVDGEYDGDVERAAVALENVPKASSRSERNLHGARYALLLYTASPDAEGTLGGLVQEARRIEDHLRHALRTAALCSNDPVCAEHVPGRSRRSATTRDRWSLVAPKGCSMPRRWWRTRNPCSSRLRT